ncbi:DUF4430 domain-containing protein [Candidatus Woesearchaeota archaeon]|nr:DUF4430 domain-containing protein [Candidatus Woesearchaeota archaeon]
MVSLILAGCFPQQKQGNSEGEATLIIDTLGSLKNERFKFKEGTPLGILRYNHKVETILNDNFIECIDGVCADGNYMWLFYINNKTANYGVKRYTLRDGDVVRFEFSDKGLPDKEEDKSEGGFW